MIVNLAILLGFQLAGEVIVRALGLPLPGPVIGMGLLWAAMTARPALAARIHDLCDRILAHLALLFVPAGVGVVGHATTFGREGLGIAAAILGSTALAILAAAATFVWVARWTGGDAGAPDG